MSFITGSRAYGYPTSESDTDLVILVSQEELETLIKAASVVNEPTPETNSFVTLLNSLVPTPWRSTPGSILGDGDSFESEDDHYGTDNIKSANLKFGKLNLICLTDPEEYEIWKNGTAELIARAPVQRDEAVALFRSRKQAWINGTTETISVAPPPPASPALLQKNVSHLQSLLSSLESGD